MLSRKVFSLFVGSFFLLCLTAAVGGAGQSASAQPSTAFGPETFNISAKKLNATRAFTASPGTPYTLTLVNGASDGSSRVKKGTITLNGNVIFNGELLNKRTARLVVALHPAQQNELTISLKGAAGKFVTVTIEPTRSTVLNDVSEQEGLGVPFGVAVDQSTHRAYVADRYADTIFEFDIAAARILRSFTDIDGDASVGTGATSGISINSNARTVVASNEGQQGSGSLAVVNLASGAMSHTPLSDSNGDIHPVFVAVNSNNNAAAFNVLTGTRARQAHFIDLSSGAITTRDEGVALVSVAANSFTNEFVFTSMDQGAPPALFVYSALPPFQRASRIQSSARAGTSFDRVAINPATNVAVAVNQRDSAVFLFDLAAGREIARIPILVGNVTDAAADVAINPETNQAVVTSRYINLLTVINLTTRLVVAEIPLPEGVRPNGVAVDNQLNRAVISENGLASSRRNGSIFVVQLPTP